MNADTEAPATGSNQITIKIDKATFRVDSPSMTGQQLRELEEPPIGPDRDLFLVVPGPADDLKVEADQAVELKNGTHFFTAPSTITPGVDAPPC